MIAFGCAAVVDAVLYHFLRDRLWYERVNGSNIGGAATDSLVFVALWPFGFQFTYAFTLFAAKVAGGVVWATVLRERWTQEELDELAAQARDRSVRFGWND